MNPRFCATGRNNAGHFPMRYAPAVICPARCSGFATCVTFRKFRIAVLPCGDDVQGCQI